MKKITEIRPEGEPAEMIKAVKRKIVISSMTEAFVILMLVAIFIGIYCRSVLLKGAFDEMSYQLSAAFWQQSSSDTALQMCDKNIDYAADIPVYIVVSDNTSGETKVLAEEFNFDGRDIGRAMEAALSSGKLSGIINGQNLMYHIHVYGQEKDIICIAFADYAHFMLNMLMIYLNELAVVLFLMLAVLYFSRRSGYSAVKPIMEMWQKQEQFIADASHELRTPLTVIRANNGILRNHAEDSVASQMKWIESTEAETKNLAALVEDLILLTKKDGIAASMEKGIDLSKLVQNVCLNFDALAYEKKIRFDFTVEDEIYVTGSVKWLMQLITILVDNAIKYEPERGSVEVKLREESGKAVLTVANMRSHIDEENIPRLFDRFYRTDKARSSGGFGLGLPIAKNIVDSHNGTVKVESGKLEGCAFVISLPVENYGRNYKLI